MSYLSRNNLILFLILAVKALSCLPYLGRKFFHTFTSSKYIYFSHSLFDDLLHALQSFCITGLNLIFQNHQISVPLQFYFSNESYTVHTKKIISALTVPISLHLWTKISGYCLHLEMVVLLVFFFFLLACLVFCFFKEKKYRTEKGLLSHEGSKKPLYHYCVLGLSLVVFSSVS